MEKVSHSPSQVNTKGLSRENYTFIPCSSVILGQGFFTSSSPGSCSEAPSFAWRVSLPGLPLHQSSSAEKSRLPWWLHALWSHRGFSPYLKRILPRWLSAIPLTVQRDHPGSGNAAFGVFAIWAYRHLGLILVVP